MIRSPMLHVIQWSTPRLSRAVTSSRSSAAVACMQERSLFSATTPLLEKKIVNVPTMGDSITEGTIVEWTAAVGQAVKEGDIVALVETDKVTVDIKATSDGVIVQQFGAVDDTVEVGASLYEIDTEAEVTAVPQTTDKESAAEAEAAVEEESPVVAAEASSPKHTRNPLIHFLGKDGWAKRLSGNETNVATETTALSSPTTVVTVQGDIHPMYGRPSFTEIEMEALVLGGADLAPSVVLPSGGARFSV